MRKRTFVAALLGVAVLLAAGGLMASNMGFKLNYLLQKKADGISASGLNTLALPYNQQTSLINASDLFADINATVAGSALSVSRLARETDTLNTYDGGSPLDDFSLNPGTMYIIQIGCSPEPCVAVNVPYVPQHY